MLRELVVHYTPLAIIGVVALFALAKLLVIASSGVRHNYFQIFIGSLAVVSKQEIKNTFEEHLQKYYKSSNVVNTLFYSTITLIMVAYLLMVII